MSFSETRSGEFKTASKKIMISMDGGISFCRQMHKFVVGNITDTCGSGVSPEVCVSMRDPFASQIDRQMLKSFYDFR